MARFVLVHGAWHGGWCFAAVAEELERRGHSVHAPDLPCEEVGLTPRDYAESLGTCRDAVVVGHSLGGLTIPHVDCAGRVFLAALLPLADVYAEALLPEFGGWLRDEQGRSFWPSAQLAHERLYPDCTGAQAETAFRQLRRQAPLEPIAASLEGRNVAVVTTRDAAVDPAWQRRAAERLGLEVRSLDTGHSPFLTHPVELAQLLEEVSRRTTRSAT